MDGCGHGMDPDWCYQCRVEASGEPPHAVWGLQTAEHDPNLTRTGAMAADQASELRFLCKEFGEDFDATLTEGEAALVIATFLDEPMSASQTATLGWLSQRTGAEAPGELSYGRARSAIRRLVALRGLRSA